MSVEHNSLLTIGMPVYNNEKFVHDALESLLNQTYGNFEIIISDNSSTDNTSKICLEYEKKDKRIRYIRQKENIGPHKNFRFVLEQARGEYFMWAATDDYWLPQFIEYNMKALENNRNLVGSISQINLYYDRHDDKFIKFENYDNQKFVFATNGNYEERVRTALRAKQASNIYSVFRTKELVESWINDIFWTLDFAVLLRLLKRGDFNIINEVLMYRYQQKTSKSIIGSLLRLDVGIKKIIFLGFPFTIWCWKNLGKKIFIKNIMFFVKHNMRCQLIILLETIRICKRIVSGQEKFW